jgi:hypothetical protein
MLHQVRHNAGLRVVFQPFSGVTHAESTTYGGKGKEQQKQSLMDSGRRKFHEKWKSVLSYHGPSKLSHAPKNEKWLRDHDDVFDHATRHYAFRVLLLCLHENGPTPVPPRLWATLRVLLACRAHVTVAFVNRNCDEQTAAQLQWLGANIMPLNELVLTQRAALVRCVYRVIICTIILSFFFFILLLLLLLLSLLFLSSLSLFFLTIGEQVPCRFDLVYAHSLAAYAAVKATVNEACPAVPPQAPRKKQQGINSPPPPQSRDADLSLTPTIVDVGGDKSFKPRIDALRPADRAALGAATVLITVRSLSQRCWTERKIKPFPSIP